MRRILVIVAIVFAGCGTDPADVGASTLVTTTIQTTTTTVPAPPDLDGARQRWASEALTTYFFSLELMIESPDAVVFVCGRPGTLDVQVVDGVVTDAFDPLTRCNVDLTDRDIPLTMEELHDFVEETVTSTNDPFEVTTEFAADGSLSLFFIAFDGGSVDIYVYDMQPGRRDTRTAEVILADLTTAQVRWAQVGVENYRFTLRLRCFCLEEYRGPFDVEVRDGELFEVTREGGEVPEQAPDSWFTIPGLFAEIESLARSDRLDVTYHPDLGYPILIDADPLLNAIDEEVAFEITSFEELG